jgi:hypothetical protein
MNEAAAQPAPTGSRTPTVVCVDVYLADLRATDRWAFTFVPSTGRGKITIYAPAAASYRVGQRYTLNPA